jgi:hypothetical protein
MRHHRPAAVLVPVLSLSILALAALSSGCAAAAAGQAEDPPAAAEPTVQGQESPAAAATPSPDIAEQWGIEITSLRLTANDHMLDYRYRVLDAEKATDLFNRQIKPYLIHQPTGKVMSVPETAKIGPLRNSNIPQEGKIYWMFFGNAGRIVQPGDKVTVVIGEFRVEDIVVE